LARSESFTITELFKGGKNFNSLFMRRPLCELADHCLNEQRKWLAIRRLVGRGRYISHRAHTAM
jgi:hypothetical protein